MSARSIVALFAVTSFLASCGGRVPSDAGSSANPARTIVTSAAPVVGQLAAVRADLAPTGTLRVGIVGRPAFIAVKDSTGQVRGLGVDLATALGKNLGAAVSTEVFDSPPQALNASERWDVLLVPSNADDATAAALLYTGPFLLVPHSYLVSDAAVRTPSDLNDPAMRIAVEMSHAAQVRAQLPKAQIVVTDADQGLAMLRAGSVMALANARFDLLDDVKTLPGYRVLDGSFFTAQLSIGVARSRVAGSAWLKDFVEGQRASGALQRLADATGKEGLTVPAAGY